MILKYLRKYTTSQERVLFLNKIRTFKAIFNYSNLNRLAKIHETDKWGAHWYTQHYHYHFNKFRNKSINFFEIGAGGYTSPFMGGNSLRMWKSYFKNSNIYSLDIHDKSPLNETRIKIFQGSQTDKDLLLEINKLVGPFDIIIDDGSHINENVITTFKILFPLLKDGGIYAVEDTQTSYFEEFGGDLSNLDNPKTMINYFKSFIDGLNHVEYNKIDYVPSYFEKNIQSIHFYHNLIFIYKKEYVETSNLQKTK